MPRALRRCASAAPAAAVVAFAWLRLERPLAEAWRGVLLAGMALAVAALPSRAGRLAAAVVSALLAVRLAFGVSLLPPRPLAPGAGFGLGAPLAELGSRVASGFRAFYAVHLPFDPRVQVDMRGLVLVAIFLFGLLVALAAAERLVAGATAALVVGAGWPATLLDPARGLFVGTGILLAGLALLAGLGSRRVSALVLPTAVAVGVAAWGMGAAAAGRPLLAWQGWSPAGGSAGSVSVGFVWNAQYGGLDWPSRRTVVLQVRSPRPPRYLRAAVLDDFDGDAWRIGPPRQADALEPAAAFRRASETREVVTVGALSGDRLVGGSVPVGFFAGGAPLEQQEPGFALLPSGLTPDFRYTAWSYAPRVSAAALRRSPPAYPAALADEGFFVVGDGASAPAFGLPDHAAGLSAFEALHPALHPYLPLARLAERLAGGAPTPYDAAASLERWFVRRGGFRYSDHPRQVAPALVGFVTRTRSGYCQYFAGAMALMLRYLGIPARVAVGFSGGTYESSRRAWVVTDHDAHAWVEVWFKGHGWLPFDPTPPSAGRAAGGDATGAAAALPGPAGIPGAASGSSGSGGGSQTVLPANHLGRIRPDAAGGAGGGWPAALLVPLAIAALVGAIAGAKAVVRLLRRRERDPRRVAVACREELADFLVDQGFARARHAPLQELGELARLGVGGEAGPFVAAATEARFAPPGRAVAASGEARRELRALLREVRRGLTRRERVAGLLSPRSLLPSRAPVGGSASLGSAGS